MKHMIFVKKVKPKDLEEEYKTTMRALKGICALYHLPSNKKETKKKKEKKKVQNT